MYKVRIGRWGTIWAPSLEILEIMRGRKTLVLSIVVTLYAPPPFTNMVMESTIHNMDPAHALEVMKRKNFAHPPICFTLRQIVLHTPYRYGYEP